MNSPAVSEPGPLHWLHHPITELNATMFMLLATRGMFVMLAFILTIRSIASYNLGLLKAFRRRPPPRPPAAGVGGLAAARAQHHPAGE